MEGYCVKCKTKREIKDAAEVTMKNGEKSNERKMSNLRNGNVSYTRKGLSYLNFKS